VFGLEVGEEVLLAGMEVVEDGVGNGDDAVPPAGALAVDVMKYIRPAADLVVGRQARALRHPTVPRRRHYDHLVARARHVERVRKTVFTHLYIRTSAHPSRSTTSVLRR